MEIKKLKIQWLSKLGVVVGTLMLLEGACYYVGFTWSVGKLGIVLYGLASTFWGKPFSLWSTKIAERATRNLRGGMIFVPALDTLKGVVQILLQIGTTLLLYLIVSALRLTPIGQYIPY